MENKDYRKIAKRIRECREDHGLTLEDVGKLVGHHKSTVQRWETGDTQKISLPTIQSLAQHYGVSVKWLMGEDSPKAHRADVDVFSIPDVFPIKKKKVPMLGEIACGEPILAEECFNGYVDAGSDVKADYCIKARGDSMIGARILDGDIIFIHQQPDVNDGEIAAICIDNEVTLKRVYHQHNALVLQSENPQYPPMIFNNKNCNQALILGKAVAFQSNIK